jgi:hypothetical protein
LFFAQVRAIFAFYKTLLASFRRFLAILSRALIAKINPPFNILFYNLSFFI